MSVNALQKWFFWMNGRRKDLFNDIGLLIMRLVFGGTMLLGHGYGKIMAYGQKAASFPDPIGLGGATSMALAIFAEFFCSILIILGLATRFAALPLVITMAVAFFIFHSADPFGKKELALLFMAAFSTLFLTGGGRFSIDGLFRRKMKS
jgi:putative oxidoreductase